LVHRIRVHRIRVHRIRVHRTVPEHQLAECLVDEYAGGLVVAGCLREMREHPGVQLDFLRLGDLACWPGTPGRSAAREQGMTHQRETVGP
jgi:hypothetical protein